MTRALLKKYVSESIWLWFACGLALFAFSWVRVWIVCQFNLSKLEPLLEQLRPFEKFSPVPLEQVLTYAGSLAMTFDEPVVIMCVLIWCIARGSDVVSGELGRGTMEMLLAQPVSRPHLLACHGFVSIIGLVGLCGLMWLGLYFGIQTNVVHETLDKGAWEIPFFNWKVNNPLTVDEVVDIPLSQRVSPNLFIPPTLNLFSFGFFVYSLSVFFSAIDRYRWRTIGAVLGVYVLQFLTFLLSKSSPRFEAAAYWTFFSAYQPDAIVRSIGRYPELAWALLATNDDSDKTLLGPLGVTLLLITMGVILNAAATWWFSKRYLPAPL